MLQSIDHLIYLMSSLNNNIIIFQQVFLNMHRAPFSNNMVRWHHYEAEAISEADAAEVVLVKVDQDQDQSPIEGRIVTLVLKLLTTLDQTQNY